MEARTTKITSFNIKRITRLLGTTQNFVATVRKVVMRETDVFSEVWKDGLELEGGFGLRKRCLPVCFQHSKFKAELSDCPGP